MTRHELWTAIQAMSADVDRLVASAAGDLPNHRPITTVLPRSTTPHLETRWRELPSGANAGEAPRLARTEPLDDRDQERLAGLRVAVRERLDRLWTALDDEVGYERIRRALVIHIDERIMHLLPEYLRLGWPLLQTDITRSAFGGREFFAAIDEALHDPRTPALVFEVHYYCLSHGFIGMFGTDTARLDAYRARLAEQIPHPSAVVAAPGGDDEVLAEPWPLWRYYALAILAVVGSGWLLVVLSNRAEGGMW